MNKKCLMNSKRNNIRTQHFTKEIFLFAKQKNGVSIFSKGFCLQKSFGKPTYPNPTMQTVLSFMCDIFRDACSVNISFGMGILNPNE